MTKPGDAALRDALRVLAEADAAGVLSAARARARDRAAEVLEDALVEELLAAASRSAAPDRDRAPSPAPDPPTAESPATGDAWWMYCVLAASDTDRVPQELEGIEAGTRVEIVREGQLAALVSAVPAHEYDDVHLRERLEDLAWVERTARRHEDVLEATLREATIVPLRLCTLFHDLDGVRQLLRDHAPSLLDGLHKVDGCAEWGVKVFAGSTETADSTAEQEPESPDVGSGATYLMARQRERDRREQAAEVRTRCAETVHARIAQCAKESISNPPQRPELHGRDMAMLLNGAYLVAAERTNELHEAIDSLRAEWDPRGFVIELTGPWPAYNFVSGAAGVMR